MATNEMQNGCGSSIEAGLASNYKRRCVYSAGVVDVEDPIKADHNGFVLSVKQEWFGGGLTVGELIPGRSFDKEVSAEDEQSHLAAERNRIDVPVHQDRP